MQPIIESLQRKNALLVLGRAAGEDDALQAACANLARLPFLKVVTLENRASLAAAWRRTGRQVNELDLEADKPLRLDPARVTWLALPDAGQPEPAWLASLLRTWFATHRVLFLGCDLEDARFKQRYREMATAAGPHRPPYQAVLAQPLAQGDQRNWEAQNVGLIVDDPAAWSQTILAGWAEAERERRAEYETSAVPAGRPYQFLAYYTEADAGRFFGRQRAIRELGELVLAEQLVVCFGPSGVGKTSLLQAGLMPRLRSQGCLPIYSRPEADPVAAVWQAVGSQHATPDRQGASLTTALSGLAQREARTVVVLLDQLEEVFTLLGEETIDSLGGELAAWLRLPEIPVHVVLSLREDYLAHLHALQPHLPGLFDHRFRLRPLTLPEARQAVERPAALFDLHYETGLTAQLLEDMSHDDGSVEPANLQIVCEALYRDLEARGEDTFRLERYRALGGADALLAGYLDQVVAEETNPGHVQAVLKAMVTAQGTKAALPAGEIARLAGLDLQATIAVLQRLDRPHRLVRPLRQEGEQHYELAHEVLAPRILGWIQDPAEREAKTVQDLLRAELHNWRQFGVLPGPGKLRAVHAQRDNPYLRLGRDEVELLLRGAVEHDVEPAVWLARAETAAVAAGDFLLPALASPQAEVRSRAADLLGPESAVAELARLLQGEDPAQRARAATTLADVSPPGAWRVLLGARHDRDPLVRDAVWEGMAAIDPRRAGQTRRQDAVAPLLAGGSILYWLGLVLAWPQTTPSTPWPVLALAAGLWLAALAILGRFLPWLSVRLAGDVPLADVETFDQPAPWGHSLGRRLVTGALLLTGGWLLISAWGWLWGGLALLLVALGIRGRAYLAAAALLAYLAWLVFLPAAANDFLLVTGSTLIILAILSLAVPRWRGATADRSAAAAVLGAGAGAVAGALLAGSFQGGLGGVLAIATMLAAGRWIASRPLTYSGGSQAWVSLIADFLRILWDFLDELSFALKPLLGGIFGAVWAAALVGAASALPPGTTPAWTLIDGLWLGLGVSLGLWGARRGLLGVLLLPALGGALGGALAQGPPGAVVGACIGVGLALGEWLSRPMADSKSQIADGKWQMANRRMAD